MCVTRGGGRPGEDSVQAAAIIPVKTRLNQSQRRQWELVRPWVWKERRAESVDRVPQEPGREDKKRLKNPKG